MHFAKKIIRLHFWHLSLWHFSLCHPNFCHSDIYYMSRELKIGLFFIYNHILELIEVVLLLTSKCHLKICYLQPVTLTSMTLTFLLFYNLFKIFCHKYINFFLFLVFCLRACLPFGEKKKTYNKTSQKHKLSVCV